jgi:hypothetical protein
MTELSSGPDIPGESADPAPGGYCPACGAPCTAGQSYCGRCGSRLVTDASAGSISGETASFSQAGSGAGNVTYPAPQAKGQGADDIPYGTGATVGAVLLTVVMPVISLIVAIALRSQESRLKRRQFLKTWAIGSGIWLCTGWLIPLIAFSSATSGVAGCKGGIDQSVPPSYVSSDGVHWRATYSCMNGGTETRSVPDSQVPGG